MEHRFIHFNEFKNYFILISIFNLISIYLILISMSLKTISMFPAPFQYFTQFPIVAVRDRLKFSTYKEINQKQTFAQYVHSKIVLTQAIGARLCAEVCKIDVGLSAVDNRIRIAACLCGGVSIAHCHLLK